MKRFIEGENRSQSMLFPESLDENIAEDNAVRVVDAFVNKLDLMQLGFERAAVASRSSSDSDHHPALSRRQRGRIQVVGAPCKGALHSGSPVRVPQLPG
jgi:hypothetical protein